MEPASNQLVSRVPDYKEFVLHTTLLSAMIGCFQSLLSGLLYYNAQQAIVGIRTPSDTISHRGRATLQS